MDEFLNSILIAIDGAKLKQMNKKIIINTTVLHIIPLFMLPSLNKIITIIYLIWFFKYNYKIKKKKKEN
jgi:hypothetical protein